MNLLKKRILLVTYCLFQLMFANNILLAQTVFETSDKNVYKFLDRLKAKGIINFQITQKPYSKSFIAEQLEQVLNYSKELNEIELENLIWYISKYALEKDSISHILGELNYSERDFKLRLYPIFGYGISKYGNKSGRSTKIGAHVEGYYSNYFGASFEYLDYVERGGNIDREKRYTPNTAFDNNVSLPERIDFSDVRGQINLNWNWGHLSLKKDYIMWGSGNFGQIILSDKPASYPHLELSLNPVEGFQFSYIHGWLNSLVVDSNSIHISRNSSLVEKEFGHFIPKYVVANIATFTPWNWLEFSIGNSFVYSGPLRPEMFIPFMYYKVMDHNTGRGSWGDGNGALFIDYNINYPKNFQFYGTLFIDNLDIGRSLKGDMSKTWLAYTVGASAFNLGLYNLDIFVEYTKVNPWIYENQYDITSYKHLDYVLGHWIGENSDLLTIGIDYSIIRGFNISLETQLFRKGGVKDIYFAYYEPSELPFLSGPQRIEKSIKIRADYEVIHNLFLSAEYSYSTISDEDINRTLDFKLGNQNYYSFNFRYGINRN